MQNITIFSLGRNIDSLKEVLEKSIFSKKIFYKSNNEIDLLLKNRSLLCLNFFKEFDENFFSIKHETLLNFEDLVVTNKILKVQIVNYIKESRGVVNISCEKEFDDESFSIISNLAKVFEAIIYVDGVIVNSDSRVLMDLNGNSETTDFIGSFELFPMDMTETNSYLDILKTIPMEINKYIPMVKIKDKIKTKEEVVKRALALTLLASYAEGLEKTGNVEVIRNVLFSQSRKYNIAGSFSENELNFLFNNKPSQYEISYFIKEYEAANLLFWSISMVDDLSFPPVAIFNYELINLSSKFLNLTELLERALFKDASYILKNYDLNHKILRSALDNKFSGKEVPIMINLDILENREKAFNWITSNLEWDKVWGKICLIFWFL